MPNTATIEWAEYTPRVEKYPTAEHGFVAAVRLSLKHRMPITVLTDGGTRYLIDARKVGG